MRAPLRPSLVLDKLHVQLRGPARRRLVPSERCYDPQRLLARAFSDVADPVKHQHGHLAVGEQATGADSDGAPKLPANGFLNGAAAYTNGSSNGTGGDEIPELEGPLALEEPPHDIEFTAQRIGFPILNDDGEGFVEVDDDTERMQIREESREHSTAMAERILAVMRHSMTELAIGKIVHRVAQYATLPRVTVLSRKQFLRSLENRFGDEHRHEYELFLAFLQGKDDAVDRIESEGLANIGALDVVGDVDAEGVEIESAESALDESATAMPTIIGLHPDLAADPQLIGIVFCYCRLACLNSLKLVQRPTPGEQRNSKSTSLWQVKNDFRKVLDMEGFPQFADILGLDKLEAPEGSVDLAMVDAEWEEFNLENDRIDFRMLMAQTHDLIELMKRELPNETIAKMLVTMLASLKTSKLHRKIFQEMVCNIQTAFPEQHHEAVLSQLVPFLSGNNATYEDFDSVLASSTLQHHRMRHEAILRSLLECRMRVGHILIHDIDEVDPEYSVSTKLTPEQREKVVATAWNIVSVLDDRQYHMFFSRFLKYKLAWRPNRSTFAQTFLDDIRKTIGERSANFVMPLFEQTYNNLSVETLTICRVKLRHSHKLLRARGALEPLDDRGRERLDSIWRSDRSAFYRNLPHGVTEKHLRDALAHVGEVDRFFLFSGPVNGAPDETLSDDELAGVEGEYDGDEEITDEGSPSEKESTKANPRPRRSKAVKTPKHKTHVIASDKKTKYHALVEFSSPEARDRAMMHALQIFGVMMAGWKEYRPVFSSEAQERTSISIQNVPMGTRVGDLLDEVNAVLERDGGLSMQVSGVVPRDVLITSGRMDFNFPSFPEAAQVVELLHEHVRNMKSRRELSGEDVNLNLARTIHLERRVKEMKKAARVQKAAEKAKAEAEATTSSTASSDANPAKKDAFFIGVGDDMEDDDVEDEEEEAAPADEPEEDDDAYFASLSEQELELTAEQLAQRDLFRPFDVTWTPPPKSRNKHLYL